MSAAPRTLRLGVLQRLFEIPRSTGHGKVWSHTLEELSRLTNVVAFATPDAAAEVDVWLNDGHGGPLSLAGKPIVTVVHEAGWDTDFLRSFLEPAFLQSIEQATGQSCRQADAVIVPAMSSRAQLIGHYGLGAEKIHVVPDGVDHTVFRRGLEGGAQIIARAGGDRDLPYVLAVAALAPRKNLPALRAAMDELALRGYPHQLAIVSTAPRDRPNDAFRDQLLGPLERSGRRVIALENLAESELAAVMASAAVLCHPSFMEGFGLPVLEAMACGTPVVVSTAGALPELAGSAGLVVPPTAEACRDALSSLFDHPARATALGEQGFQRAAEFSWAKTAHGWLKVIEEVAAHVAENGGGARLTNCGRTS